MFGPPLQETLYAPLTFTVGRESVSAQQSGTFAGNLESVARTGTIGDGKIFVTKIDEAIRIRNDERGEMAL